MAFFGASCTIVDDDIFHHIKKLLGDVYPGEDVFLITPYVQLDNKIQIAIREVIGKGVGLHLLTRPDSKISSQDNEFLASARIEVRELPDLHAKVYWSQRQAIVTSMNLYRYSDRNCHELAVIFEDGKSIDQVRQSVDRWWIEARPVSVLDLAARANKRPSAASPKLPVNAAKADRFGATSRTAISEQSGYCIRCGDPKPFNTKKPLCDACYDKWAKYKNPQYPEKFCHRCKRSLTTTINEPLCESCSHA